MLLADFENRTGDDVFNGTLKQALAVQLATDARLNPSPNDRVRETLRYMGCPADERLTREVAREQLASGRVSKRRSWCSIAQRDRRYSIILEAINSQTG